MKKKKTNRLKKANEKERHRRKNDCRENLIASNAHLTSHAVFTPKRKTCGLTVCVTCAGAGTAKPSNWKNAEA